MLIPTTTYTAVYLITNKKITIRIHILKLRASECRVLCE